jgi:undecaprenyl-diphosphatase
MVIPLIFGKIIKDLIGGELFIETIDITSLTLGFIAAFISGLIACTWMIKLVRQSKLTYFSIYCMVVGLIAIFISL